MARRLRAAWENNKTVLGLTQERAADALGWTQGAVGAYLRGDIPLNLNAIIKFARLLGIPARDIDPEIGRDVDEITATGVAEDAAVYGVENIPLYLRAFIRQCAALDEDQILALSHVVRALTNSGGPTFDPPHKPPGKGPAKTH